VTARIGIIGGGPVGLFASIVAANAGHQVTVIDSRSGPVDKACGEGLMPGALRLLLELGLTPSGRPLLGVGYNQGSNRATHLFRRQTGQGVRRTDLHSLLADAASAAGVKSLKQKVVSVEAGSATEPGKVATAEGESVSFDYLLACDGLHSTTAKSLGVSVKRKPRISQRFGLRQHFDVAPWSDLIEVYYTPSGELYVTPVSETEVGVAILGERGLNLQEQIALVPEVSERLAGRAETSTLMGSGPFPQKTSRRVIGRVLLVGDASGYVDAITGEGLRVGFEQARLAVEAINQGSPKRYEKSWRGATRGFRVLTSGLALAARSPFRSKIVPAAKALPKIFGAVVERLAR
jgi:menaquinone-9 beta-reductase